MDPFGAFVTVFHWLSKKKLKRFASLQNAFRGSTILQHSSTNMVTFRLKCFSNSDKVFPWPHYDVGKFIRNSMALYITDVGEVHHSERFSAWSAPQKCTCVDCLFGLFLHFWVHSTIIRSSESRKMFGSRSPNLGVTDALDVTRTISDARPILCQSIKSCNCYICTFETNAVKVGRWHCFLKSLSEINALGGRAKVGTATFSSLKNRLPHLYTPVGKADAEFDVSVTTESAKKRCRKPKQELLMHVSALIDIN